MKEKKINRDIFPLKLHNQICKSALFGLKCLGRGNKSGIEHVLVLVLA
jgi:hypothetical protein